MAKQWNADGMTRWGLVHFYTRHWRCPVLPCSDKKAPTVQWRKYQAQLPTWGELKEWHKEQRHYGLALVMGQVSGNIFRLDIDDEAVLWTLREIDAVPPTAPIFSSQRSGHYGILLKSSTLVPKIPQGRIKDMPNLGINGEGSITVVPDTPGYKWLELHAEIPSIGNFQQWFEAHFKYADIRGLRIGVGDDRGIMEQLLETEQGQRDNTLISLVAKFRNKGFSEDEVVSILTPHALRWPYSDEHWTQEEVEQNIRKKFGQYPDQIPKQVTVIPDEKLVFGADEQVRDDRTGDVIQNVAWLGDVGLLYAQAGVGKTSYATSICADLVTGSPVLGRWPTLMDCDVFYINLENPMGETEEAIRRACTALGKPEAAAKVHVAELPGRGFDIFNPEWAAWVDRQLDGYKSNVLLIDNVGKAVGRDVTLDPEAMRRYVKITRDTATGHNILVISVHHAGWSQYDRMGRELPSHEKGPSVLRDDANFVFEIVRLSHDITRLTVRKIRSRKAGLRMGDMLYHYYDAETMRVVPTEEPQTVEKLKWLVEQHGYTGASNLLGCSQPAVSNWIAGRRTMGKDYRARLDELVEGKAPIGEVADLIT